jgi:hypothetical protein
MNPDAMNSLTRQWEEESYLLVRGLFDAQTTNELKGICEYVLTQWRQRCPLTEKAGSDTPNASSMRHLNHPGYFENNPEAKAELLERAADPKILDICRQILGAEPMFRCTSLFMNPLVQSTDGPWHRDSQFMHPDEAEEKKVLIDGGMAGKSIQLQITLIPSSDVEIVPGSHLRWDTAEEYAIRRANGGENRCSNSMPNARRVAMQPGDAIAFNPLCLHRGRYHTDKARLTFMLTYTSQSYPVSDYFSYQPWFLQENYLAGLTAGTRQFYQRYIDQYRSYWQTADKATMGR